MPRPVFFAADARDTDSGRTALVVQTWRHTREGEGSYQFAPSDWHELRKQTDAEIKREILRHLQKTVVTVVLVGDETHARRWVRHEILRTLELGHGLLAVQLPPEPDTSRGHLPENPLDQIYFQVDYARQAILLWEWDRKTNRWTPPEDVAAIPLARVKYPIERAEGLLSNAFHTYDWLALNGTQNFGRWVELAARYARQ